MFSFILLLVHLIVILVGDVRVIKWCNILIRVVVKSFNAWSLRAVLVTMRPWNWCRMRPECHSSYSPFTVILTNWSCGVVVQCTAEYQHRHFSWGTSPELIMMENILVTHWYHYCSLTEVFLLWCKSLIKFIQMAIKMEIWSDLVMLILFGCKSLIYI